MFRLGLLLSGGARGPGVFFIIPCVDIVEIVDMRVQVFNVPPQEVIVLYYYQWSVHHHIITQILTKDSVTVYVSAIMWYKVKDATSAIANVDDYSGSAKLLAATTLRCP